MDNVKEKLDAMVKDYDQARIKGSPDEMVVTSSYLKRALEDAYRSGDLVTREELEAAVEAEREACGHKAREFAAHYPQGSDGRNTFIILAEQFESNNIGRALEAVRARGETNDQ